MKRLDRAKPSATDALNTASKRANQQKQLATKLSIKLRGFQKLYNNIIQKQLLMSMIKKYLKKYIYL